ncbi:MAG: UDP-glucose 4-epimerase GalE [Verrucomicrobia bacterium]|nr:UDP-glucose 4-epimerase GalE [Verrucomicrobiota bacterium]
MKNCQDLKAVVITGGAGFIGSHIAKTLYRAGYLPIVIDHLGRGDMTSVQWGPLEKGDIRDRSFVDDILEKYQPVSVIHCAALAYVGESCAHPAMYYNTNVEGTLTLLESLVHAEVESIIFASSCATYGHAQTSPISEDHPLSPINPYGWSKWMGEQMIRDFAKAYGLKYAILRYFNVAGSDLDYQIGENHHPETHLIPLALEAAMTGKPLQIFGEQYATVDGTAVRDYVHVQDVSSAHVCALEFLQESKAVTLNIGSGQGYSIRQILDEVESLLKKPVPYKIRPPRPGDPPYLIADTQRAKDILEWHPQHSDLTTLISTAWGWYNQKKQLGYIYENTPTHPRLSSQVQCGI